MSNTYLNEITGKFLITILTATTVGLFGWVWKTSAEIAIWKTQIDNTEQRIKKLEEGIKDRYTRTQADRKHKEQEDRHQRITEMGHTELHGEIGRLDSQMDGIYERLDDRLREMEKSPRASLQNEIGALREQIREIKREKDDL